MAFDTVPFDFTSHEEFEGMGLVNMNARLYDPLIGRFISADSVIPDAEKSLAYNRYMYVYGNPVSYRDPDGHIGIVAVGVIAAVAFFTTAHMTDSEILQAASTIALGASLSYATAGLLNSGFIGAGLAGSFSSITVSFAKTGQLTEQSLKSAAIAGIAAAVAYGIGHGGPNGASPFENSAFFKAGIHGVTSGMRSVLEGGEFHHGLISGLAGHFSGVATDGLAESAFNNFLSRTMVAASFGGLSSWATGGDFVQSAIIAATIHLFNDEGRTIVKESPQERVDRLNANISRDFPSLANAEVIAVENADTLFKSRNGAYIDDGKIIVEYDSIDELVQAAIFHERLHVDESMYVSNGSQNKYVLHEVMEWPYMRHDSLIPIYDMKHYLYLKSPELNDKPDINNLLWRMNHE